MGIAGRLNGILHFIENPCNEPWAVFIEAAQPWANQAAMSLLGIDTMQTVRTALNPAGKRTGRHMRKGTNAEHPGEHGVPGIPDPYEYLGHQLKKPIEDFIHANSTWGTKALFVITGKIESGLWQYMLIDEATKLLYHSLADARKSVYCQRWSKGDYLRSSFFLLQLAAGWVAMDVPIGHYQSGGVFGGFADCTLASNWQGSMTVYASLSGIATGGAGTQVHGFRLRNINTGEVLAQIGPQPYATFQPVEFVLDATVYEENTTVFVEYYQELGALVGTGIIMATCTGGPKKPPQPPKQATNWPRRPKKPPREKKGVHRTSGGGKVYDVPTLLAYRKRHPPE